MNLSQKSGARDLTRNIFMLTSAPNSRLENIRPAHFALKQEDLPEQWPSPINGKNP